MVAKVGYWSGSDYEGNDPFKYECAEVAAAVSWSNLHTQSNRRLLQNGHGMMLSDRLTLTVICCVYSQTL